MLNEVKSEDIKRRIREATSTEKEIEEKIKFEIARREDTVDNLGKQIRKEREEIEFLRSLNPTRL